VIRGIGLDMIEVARVRDAVARHGERFLRRIYAPIELESQRGDRDQYLAARFASKEAAMKALGTGFSSGVRWVDIQVRNLPSGQPVLDLTGAAAERARSLGVTASHLSITHTRELAAAMVVLEGSALPAAAPAKEGSEE